MSKKTERPGFATACIHGKKHLDKHEGEKPIRAVSTPIFQSSTFAFENAEHGAAVFRGEDGSRREMSYDELKSSVAEIAAGLREAGVVPE